MAGDSTVEQDRKTLTGVAVQLPASQEQQFLNTGIKLADQYGIDAPSHAVRVYANGELWIVYTDESPQTGEVVVQGFGVEFDGASGGAFFADDVSYSLRGSEVSVSSLKNSLGRYDKELIRITMPYRQFSYTDNIEDSVTAQSTAGVKLNPLAGRFSSPYYPTWTV